VFKSYIIGVLRSSSETVVRVLFRRCVVFLKDEIATQNAFDSNWISNWILVGYPTNTVYWLSLHTWRRTTPMWHIWHHDWLSKHWACAQQSYGCYFPSSILIGACCRSFDRRRLVHL